MTTIVVPFRGPGGKRRLGALPARARRRLANAMLGDVLDACLPVGRTVLVTSPQATEARTLAAYLGVDVVDDPRGGQSEAVGHALRNLPDGTVLVVNADLPCARPPDLLALLGLLAPGGLALAEAPDGTTNALALASPRLFQPLYGPGSANRFRRHAEGLGVPHATAPLPNLIHDVDTLAALDALADRVGPRTAAALAELPATAAA
jgi:2-phospho-L-lactate/phosphoenolpyruvate guanylyltransferase